MASLLDDLTALPGELSSLSVEAVAGIIGMFTVARQTIRTLAAAFAQAITQDSVNYIMSKYPKIPLSPAVLADMSIRQLTIPADASGLDAGLVAEASLSGIDPARFAAMSLDTGESYGIEEALALWHRGTYLVGPVVNANSPAGLPTYTSGANLGQTYGIPEAELKKVIYYSRVRDEFIPDLLELSWHSMTDADAINTLVKGKADHDLALSLFEAAGGMPEQFDLLYAASGDSIGVEKAVSLWKHGIIDQATLQQIIDQSRINPAFYDVAKLTNTKWLPAYQLEKVAAAGIIDTATLTKWLEEEGYPADQAAAFATMSSAGTVHAAKAETEGMILADFEAQIITQAEATTALKNLGYTATAIPYILDTFTARRVIGMRNAAITRLRTSYVDRLIDETETRTELGKLGMPTAAIDQFVTAWQIEQATSVKRLSAAQVGHLVEYGFIDPTNATERWVQMGYPAGEASLLLNIYVPASKAPLQQPPATTTVPPAGP